MAEQSPKRKSSNVADQGTSSKQHINDPWCSTCWSRVKDTCGTDAHRVLDTEAALVEENIAYSELHEEMQGLLDRMHIIQSRVDAVKAAREEKATILVMEVQEAEGLEAGWQIHGGVLKVALAASDVLTIDEKLSLCNALTELEFQDRSKPQDASGPLDKEVMKAIFEKLPLREKGQTLKAGTILVKTMPNGGYRFDMSFAKLKCGKGRGSRVLGRVIRGRVRYEGCDYTDGRDCHSDTCICYGDDLPRAQIFNVRIVPERPSQRASAGSLDKSF